MSYEEKKRHSSELVPYSYYQCLIPDWFASVPLHFHGEFEINLVLSGASEFIVGDIRFTAHQGDIIVIQPNVLHAIYPYKDYRQRYDTIVFSPNMLGADGNDRCAIGCIKPLVSGEAAIKCPVTQENCRYEKLKSAAEAVFSRAALWDNDPLTDMRIKIGLLYFFLLLWESGDIVPNGGTSNMAGRSELIRPAVEYMNEHMAENITVEQLASIVHMSKSYFMRRFKEAAGVGAIEHLTRIRIKKACGLLSQTDMTVAAAALECGFGNLSNFNRQFRAAVGCTPKEYRKAAKG